MLNFCFPVDSIFHFPFILLFVVDDFFLFDAYVLFFLFVFFGVCESIACFDLWLPCFASNIVNFLPITACIRLIVM